MSRITLVVVLAVSLVVTTAGVAAAETFRVRAAPERWRPAHLFISEGDRVVWKNPDDRRHNVVAYGGGWRLNEMLSPGEQVRRVFDRARNEPFAFRCTLHSAIVDGQCDGMCGLVHVFDA
jgi:plastocyanin